MSGKQDDDQPSQDKSKDSNGVSKSSKKGKNDSDKTKRKLETEGSKETNELSIETPPKRKFKKYRFRINWCIDTMTIQSNYFFECFNLVCITCKKPQKLLFWIKVKIP